MVVDPEWLTVLCRRLEPFGSLEVEGGRVVWVRSFVATWDTLPTVLGRWEDGESVRVECFPENFKVRFSRLLYERGD